MPRITVPEASTSWLGIVVVVAIIGLAGSRRARVKPPKDCANWKQFLKMEFSPWNPDNAMLDWFGGILSLKCES